MRCEVHWERIFPDELEAATAECPLVYLSYGLCEPHGPRNALGMDALRPHGVACRAAREFTDVVAALATNLAAKARELLAVYERVRPIQAPRTFDQAEDIWENEVRPRSASVASVQDLAPNQKPPPESSRWYRNWRVRQRS